MSKFAGYDKYCAIDLNNKTSNCEDKYNNVATYCTVVKDNVRTFYDKKGTPAGSLDNQTLVTRDTNIDYNYFRASR